MFASLLSPGLIYQVGNVSNSGNSRHRPIRLIIEAQMYGPNIHPRLKRALSIGYFLNVNHVDLTDPSKNNPAA